MLSLFFAIMLAKIVVPATRPHPKGQVRTGTTIGFLLCAWAAEYPAEERTAPAIARNAQVRMCLEIRNLVWFDISLFLLWFLAITIVLIEQLIERFSPSATSIKKFGLIADCPPLKYMGSLSLFYNEGCGLSWLDVKLLVADGSGGGL